MDNKNVIKVNKKKTQPANTRLIVRLLFALLVLLMACTLTATAFAVTRQVAMSWSGSAGLLSPEIVQSSGTPVTNALGTPLPPVPGEGGSIAAAKLTPWDGAGRVTVLLLGLDYRDWEAGEEASRSDTMILLTLDPQSKTAGI